jgi:hypothetical protein
VASPCGAACAAKAAEPPNIEAAMTTAAAEIVIRIVKIAPAD